MSKTNAIILIACWGVATVLTLAAWPEFLSDENAFFADFFDQDFISFLAVVLTISTGLLAQLFVSVRKLNERLGEDVVSDLRSEMRNTVKWLLGVFFSSLFLVAVKPLIPGAHYAVPIVNSILLLLLIYYLLIFSGVVLSIFDFDI